jgi:hypothetical protein
MSPFLVPLAERLASLPTYFSYKDVLSRGFDGDEDAFIDAWCSGTLPLRVREAILDTMPERLLECYLLRRIVRQLADLIHVSQQPWDAPVPPPPAPEGPRG